VFVFLCPQKSVRNGSSLCAGEQEYIQKRKQVSVQALRDLGLPCTVEEVPHIAFLASGGGQRAAVSLVGSLSQMSQDRLLDTVLYLGGVSGSTWSMAFLYSDPQWSRTLDSHMSSLLTANTVELELVLSWVHEKAQREEFSLTDVSFLTVVVMSPGQWFELTPHEAGFSELELFVETSALGNKFKGGVLLENRPEMDMIQLQGMCIHTGPFPFRGKLPIPAFLASTEHVHLMDGGLLVNVAYPSFLGQRRDIDLIIAPEYSAGNMFEVRKPFPQLDDKILEEEKDWPRDCYVFEGNDTAPTVVFMPLFNRRNCKGTHLKLPGPKPSGFSTFQKSYSPDMIKFLLETAQENMRNNKETLLREISKALQRRRARGQAGQVQPEQ
uniref:PLA2c domain-containing protein n=1 Tax=Periophthalmus magnuspinnatus TaxID=409849 RepID=A0A3B3ZNL8_9GOBI